MKSSAVVLVATLIACSAEAAACSYPPPESFAASASSASVAFVFQVVSASVEIDPATGEPNSNRVVASIRITEILKGSPQFARVAFSNSWCGGNRLDVGHFFVAVTSQSGIQFNLVAADRSVLDITRAYREHDPAATARAGAISKIRAALSGHPLPAGFPTPEQIEATQTLKMPPPPAPPAKPCGLVPNNSFKPNPLRGSA
jgi:hypothetical protein